MIKSTFQMQSDLTPDGSGASNPSSDTVELYASLVEIAEASTRKALFAATAGDNSTVSTKLRPRPRHRSRQQSRPRPA